MKSIDDLYRFRDLMLNDKNVRDIAEQAVSELLKLMPSELGENEYQVYSDALYMAFDCEFGLKFISSVLDVLTERNANNSSQVV